MLKMFPKATVKSNSRKTFVEVETKSGKFIPAKSQRENLQKLIPVKISYLHVVAKFHESKFNRPSISRGF